MYELYAKEHDFTQILGQIGKRKEKYATYGKEILIRKSENGEEMQRSGVRRNSYHSRFNNLHVLYTVEHINAFISHSVTGDSNRSERVLTVVGRTPLDRTIAY